MEGALDLPGDSARPAVTMALWAPETGEAAAAVAAGWDGDTGRGEGIGSWFATCVACDESRSDGSPTAADFIDLFFRTGGLRD